MTTKSAKAKPRRNRGPSKNLISVRTNFGESSAVGVFTGTDDDATQLATVEQLDKYLEANPRGPIDIRGRVIAQLGIFKDRRGQFNQESLETIVELGNGIKKGLKSNFKHRSMSDDNIGKHLGRDTGLKLSETSSGIPCVKSSHFVIDPMALKSSPEGGGTSYGGYVAGLSISDPAAFSSSLSLFKKTEPKLDEDQQPVKDEEGNLEPDIWLPTKLSSCLLYTSDAADE